MRTGRARKGVVVAVALTLVAAGVASANAGTSASKLATETLAAINPLAPQDFGAATVNGSGVRRPEGRAVDRQRSDAEQ